MSLSTIVSAVVERGAQLPGEDQIPLAPVLHADQTAALVMVIALYAGFATVVVWAAMKALRDRELLPGVLLVAGVIAANIEPLGDHVGLIVYAPDIPWFDYWVMGRQMPSFILVAETSYVAFGSYYAYRMIAAGRSLRDIALVSAVFVGIPEIAMELLWHHWQIIAYYGENPTRIGGIPLYSIVQNSTLLPVYGVTVYLAVRLLPGARILWLVLAVPAVTIGYIVGVSWPVYEAIQSSAPAPVVWLAALATIVASVGATYAALQHPFVREARARARGAEDPAPAAGSSPVPVPATAEVVR